MDTCQVRSSKRSLFSSLLETRRDWCILWVVYHTYASIFTPLLAVVNFYMLFVATQNATGSILRKMPCRDQSCLSSPPPSPCSSSCKTCLLRLTLSHNVSENVLIAVVSISLLQRKDYCSALSFYHLCQPCFIGRYSNSPCKLVTFELISIVSHKQNLLLTSSTCRSSHCDVD